MKKSEIFERVKGVILSGRSDAICFAIDNLHEDDLITAEERRSCREWVMALLDGQITYGTWLLEHHRGWADEYNRRAFASFAPSYVQEGRLQWIDWMISYWKERGE